MFAGFSAWLWYRKAGLCANVCQAYANPCRSRQNAPKITHLQKFYRRIRVIWCGVFCVYNWFWVPKSNTGKREIPKLTEVRDTLLALYERRNDFNADNQIVVDGYTNFAFRDLYGHVYSNHRINRQLKRITAKYNQEEHAEAEQEGREKIPFPRSHVICCGIRSVRGWFWAE